MSRYVRIAVCTCFLAAAAAAAHAVPAAATAAPQLMLANVYRGGVRVSDYWVSEKLDGVRGYWDGSRLWTRGGRRIEAPAWFTAGWPGIALDGELWVGRRQFARAVSTVRQQRAADAEWRRLRFMVFDLPAHPGTFTERNAALNTLLTDLGLPWLRPVEQRKVRDAAALHALLDAVVAGGGEGLMLHRGDSLYRAERNDDLLKLKPYEDAEARVLAHLPGQGRHQGRLGALLVETAAGQRLRIGTGLRDSDRRDPPPIGSWITYRYRGLNEKTGVPRFASFLRVREDLAEGPPATKE